MSEQLSFELLDAPIVATVVDDTPPDAAARKRITTDLDSNLFVEAGAGAGKTTQLVGRVLALVRAGVPITSIAAITFTEKAAADLRHRLRDDLTAAEASAVADGRHPRPHRRRPRRPRPRPDRHAARVRPPVALRVPDRGRSAARLHGARRARERPRVPTSAGTTCSTGCSKIPTRRLARSTAGASSCSSASSTASGFDAASVASPRISRPTGTSSTIASSSTPPPRFDARHRADPRSRSKCSCTHDAPEDDTPVRSVDRDRRDGSLARARQLDPHPPRCGRAHRRAMPARPERGGNKTKWKQHGGADALDVLRDARARDRRRGRRRADPRRRGLPPAARWDRSSERSCSTAPTLARADGTLEFHDLLGVRPAAARRPDPTSEPCSTRATNGSCSTSSRTPTRSSSRSRCASRRLPTIRRTTTDWRRLRPLPGRLFIVGDPKQSIYRFRRADIAQYLRAAEQIGAETALLSANFRSSAAVIDWVNHVFSELIVEQPDVQPAYHALEVCRPRHRDHGTVHVLGADAFDDLDSRRGDAEGPAVARGRSRRRRRRHRPRRGVARRGRRTRTRSARAVPATSRSCSRHARRCRRSRRRFASVASRTGPRTARSCTPRPRSVT